MEERDRIKDEKTAQIEKRLEQLMSVQVPNVAIPMQVHGYVIAGKADSTGYNMESIQIPGYSNQ